MKKIAIFVEGQTEQFFINKLFLEIAGVKNIALILKKFQGIGKTPIQQTYPRSTAQPINPRHTVLIYDCAGDGSVKSRILEEYQGLFAQGYVEIIGLRDLYPLTDLARLENRIQSNLPQNTCIIIAVNEVEAWFLAECNHFSYIDVNLTANLIQSKVTELGFNPYTDDMTLRIQPSQDLKNVYQLVGKTYSKKKDHIERTVECLDYASLYLELPGKIQKLYDLISKIDAFLT